jgi:hypothetical protein
MRRLGNTAVLAIVLLVGGAAVAAGGDLRPALGAGLVDPNGAGTAPWFSVSLRRPVADRVVVEPELGYWSREDSSPGVDSSLSDISLGLNVLYRLTGRNDRARTRIFAGAGVGAHLLQSQTAVSGYDEVEETEVKQGMHLIVNLDYRLGGSLRFFIGVRSDLVADLTQSKVYGGIRLGR